MQKALAIGTQGAHTRNLWIYVCLETASACSFISGNWIFFWTRVMTYGQLGLVDALAFAFGMVMEIPTGVVADMVGKRWTMFLAMLCNGLGFVVMGMSDSLEVLLGGFLLAQIGWAFHSGASEAMLYDSLKADRQEAMFDRIFSRVGVLGMLTLMAAALLGGVMYNANERLPHLAWGAVFLLGALVSLGIIEPKVNNASSTTFTLRAYFQQFRAGFAQLAQPALRWVIAPIIIIRGAGFMFMMGVIYPIMAVNFGFNANAQAVLSTFLYAGAMAGSAYAPLLRRRFGNYNGLLAGGTLISLGYMSAMLPPALAVAGVLGMFAIRLGTATSNVIGTTLINDRIPSQARATTLSTVALFTRLPYVITAIVAGSMAEQGTFGWFGLAFGTGVLLFGVLGLKQRAHVEGTHTTST